jgi:hypothetical protein
VTGPRADAPGPCPGDPSEWTLEIDWSDPRPSNYAQIDAPVSKKWRRKGAGRVRVVGDSAAEWDPYRGEFR